MSPHHQVAVVGTGFGGIATAVQLRRNPAARFRCLPRPSRHMTRSKSTRVTGKAAQGAMPY
jgi:NADH dehydrogenase FAD-containing subunit